MNDRKISMVHGSGGAATGELIREVFSSVFHSEILDAMEDAAVLPACGPGERIAVTTDSFVVDPVEFPGGDIGRLAVCGTVNDLLMRGAVPKYLTAGWILEVGADVEQLKRVVHSMAETAAEAGVTLVAGDTKVIGGKGGICVNTTGVGFVPEGSDIKAAGAKPGDRILVSGTMGDHHAAILCERMTIESAVTSDVACLNEMCRALDTYRVHTLRDVTRGGLGTVLKELASASGTVFRIRQQDVPVRDSVRKFCGLLGLDPMYMGNEGKLVAIVDPADAEAALAAVKASAYGEDAALIGEVVQPDARFVSGTLLEETAVGGLRELDVLQGEGLPRIC